MRKPTDYLSLKIGRHVEASATGGFAIAVMALIVIVIVLLSIWW